MKRSHCSLTVVAGGALLATALQGMVPAEAQTRATGFQVGDRILLHVERDSALSDTFTVVAGPAPRRPYIGGLSPPRGPRGDIQAPFTPEPGPYIKHPLVAGRALVRCSVVGQLTRPRDH